jgi:hypothetical protein
LPTSRPTRRAPPPVHAADLWWGLDAAARLKACGPRAVASGRDDDGLGRWSFATAEPRATLIGRGHSLVVLDENGRPARRFTADPFEAAGAFLSEHGCSLEPQPGPPEPRCRFLG